MADLSFYDGASTGQQIDNMVSKGVITVSCGTISSLPFTKSSTYITENHVLIDYVMSNLTAQNGTWTITTANGSLTITGTMASGTSTTLTLTLGLRGAAV